MMGTLSMDRVDWTVLWQREAPVHVWSFSLSRWEAEADESLLGEEERQRARSMSLALERRRYVAAHTAMRQIVAAYCGAEPAGLRYRYGAFGKPRLAEPARARALAVSLAYGSGAARDWAALAVTRREEVGLALRAGGGSGNDDEGLIRLAWLKANGQGCAVAVRAVKFPMRDWCCGRLQLEPGLEAAVVAAGAEARVETGQWTPLGLRQFAAA